MTTPVIIDTEIAETQKAIEQKAFAASRLRSSIAYNQKYSWLAKEVETKEIELTKIENALADLKEKLTTLNGFYTGWSRAFLVRNSNGHIHKSRSCTTCFDTTNYVWLTEMSGRDELEIAYLAGEKACTVCYAHAPSAYFLRECGLEDPEVVEARRIRQARKAEIEAKRQKTGIWNPDGTPLKVYEYGFSNYKSEIKAERTAQSVAVNLMVGLQSLHREPREIERSTDAVETILVALAHKRGTSVEEQRTLVQTKVDAQIKSNKRQQEKWLAEHPEYAK
jgi:predicted Zn-dependent protease